MIAFCFLTYNHLERIDVWYQYFKNIDPSHFIVVIHSKQQINQNLYPFPIHIINDPVETKNKTDISIVKATLHLLKKTHQLNSNITHYIFLTQSCIPLYSFSQHQQIINILSKSCISFLPRNKNERYHSLHPILKNHFEQHMFVKQQPNMILTKNDVEWFIQPENDFTQHFSKMTCPDEHYFVNLMIIFNRRFIHQQINFCNIIHGRTQAEIHRNINMDFIIKLRMKGFMFMRKVDKTSNINIPFLLQN